MWNFCSLALYLQEPVPEQDTFAGIHISVHKEILDYVLADEVLPQLEKHHCDISAPCTVLLTAMRKCVPLLSVCKIWKAFVASKVDARIRVGAKSGPRSESSSVALDFSLGGRYKAYQVIEKGYDKSVLNAYDYGGPNGCHEIAEVVIKVSSRLSLHENEEDVYNRLSSSDDLLLPRLIFSGKYSQETQYRGLVLTKLGPDLERLRSRCRNNRFTPRMTLAVAIQTTRLYEKLHAQGWLHCNAKTANFAIGPDIPEVNTRIYMFDFEWSRQTEPVPYNTTSLDGQWNEDFKPVSWEMNLTPSFKDDLEGLGYILSKLERGSLAWQHMYGIDTWRCKIAIPTKKIFEGMDPVYVKYFNAVKALAWGEVPDYDGIVQLFMDAWNKRGYKGTPWDIDWWGELGLRQNTLSV